MTLPCPLAIDCCSPAVVPGPARCTRAGMVHRAAPSPSAPMAAALCPVFTTGRATWPTATTITWISPVATRSSTVLRRRSSIRPCTAAARTTPSASSSASISVIPVTLPMAARTTCCAIAKRRRRRPAYTPTQIRITIGFSIASSASTASCRS